MRRLIIHISAYSLVSLIIGTLGCMLMTTFGWPWAKGDEVIVSPHQVAQTLLAAGGVVLIVIATGLFFRSLIREADDRHR